MFRAVRSALAGLLPLCAYMMLAGCGWPLPEKGTDADAGTATTTSASAPKFYEEVLSANVPRPPATPRFEEVEPNDDFHIANLITVADEVELAGSIGPGAAAPFDRDLFELGPAYAGDQIRAELVVASGSGVVMALLDDQHRELGYVDPGSSTAGPRELDVVVREYTDYLYLAVTTRSGSTSHRDYTVRLGIQRGAGVPAYRPQVVILNFEGANQVRIGNRPPIDVPPFDASRIDAEYAGHTTTIIFNILHMVREHFAGLDLEVFLSGDPGIPEGPVSTVYFGTYDSRLLGLADNIDPYNQNLSQSAILYTDTFGLFSVLSPDVHAISQALANTTSHEIGHLVGLRHTTDPHDIMDITATARQMLVDQWFREAPLHPTVLPIGWQDAPSRLSWTLGGQLAAPPSAKTIAARQRSIDMASGGIDFWVPRSMLSGCGCPEQEVEN